MMGVMILKILKKEHKLCLICMEEHEVQTVEIEEFDINEEFSFEAVYEYCDRADELLETEEMIRKNSSSRKAARQSK